MKLIPLLALFFLCLSCAHKQQRIGIQPYGNVDEQVIASISKCLAESYDAEVAILERTALPRSAFVYIKSPRYRADTLLKELLRLRPDTIDFVIGITTKDISTTKLDPNGAIRKPESKYADWGIFGLGYLPGRSCVVSTYRLKHDNLQTFESRLKKISIHEIGHNMGLDHCPDTKCVMQDAVESIKTVDQAGFGFCSKCEQKVK